MENVLEELVGPIEDEFDEEEPLIREASKHTLELKGALPIQKLGDLVGQQLNETAEIYTVSGLMTQRLGRFPRRGDVLRLGAWELQVEGLAGTQVERIKLTSRA